MKDLGKTIVITNRKGGSGKTTSAKNIAYDLTLDGNKVLMIDLDPQCNATDGMSGREYKRNVLGFLKYEKPEKCIYKTRFTDLDFIPGSDYLASTDIPDDIIKTQLYPLKSIYDYIVIDTSPYFNKLTAEVLKASDLVIVPSILDEDSLKGAMTTISELSTLFNKQIHCMVLPTMIDNSKFCRNQLDTLKQGLGKLCFNSFIRTDYIHVRRAREWRCPLSYKYPKSKSAKDYEELTIELLEVL